VQHDLIVITFDSEADALKARGGLEIMRNSQMLGLLNTVMVTRDRAGRVIVHQQSVLPVRPPSPGSQVPGMLASAIFAEPPEEGARKLVDSGLDERFVDEVSSALIPGSSMLINYVRRDSLVDTQQLLGVLSQFKGTLYHTTVPAEVEEAILKPEGYE
jgi:uncharacterized membrane protein